MPRTRRHTPESIAVHAAFTATADAIRRLVDGTVTAAVVAGVVALALGGLAHRLALLAWEQVHPTDRRVLAAVPGLLRRGWAWLDRRCRVLAVVGVDAVYDLLRRLESVPRRMDPDEVRRWRDCLDRLDLHLRPRRSAA